MKPIRKRVVVRSDHHIHLDLDIPKDFPEGEAEARVSLTPLADFAEYS